MQLYAAEVPPAVRTTAAAAGDTAAVADESVAPTPGAAPGAVAGTKGGVAGRPPRRGPSQEGDRSTTMAPKRSTSLDPKDRPPRKRASVSAPANSKE